jgi:hypothetical protein
MMNLKPQTLINLMKEIVKEKECTLPVSPSLLRL